MTAIVAFDDRHLSEIADFWVASWVKTMPAIDFEARRPWIIAHLPALRDKGVAVRVALSDDDAPIGFITVDPTSGHIDQVCVAADHWGGSLATDLIAEAKRLSPTGLHLDVNADNPRAIAFYVRHGFVETARGANSSSGLPIIAMRWDGS